MVARAYRKQNILPTYVQSRTCVIVNVLYTSKRINTYNSMYVHVAAPAPSIRAYATMLASDAFLKYSILKK